jgi:GNAT superfamily N-acetyltransferase
MIETVIRARRQDEIDECVALLAETHSRDGYPNEWPANPEAWLQPTNLLAAWVAEHGDVRVGHVALCSALGHFAAPLWSEASGLPVERIGAVSRLFVAPSARGRGLGAALLDEACAEAYVRGLRPALDVLDTDRAAIALYERAGWDRVASVPAPWKSGNGEHTVLHCYLAPSLLRETS